MTGQRTQGGAALLVTLVLIALTSLLAFTGSQVTRLQQRLVSNDQAAQIAFQAAEAALREAFQELAAAPHLVNFCQGSTERYDIATLDDLNVDDVDAALGNGVSVSDFALGEANGEISLVKSPRYVIACLDEAAVEGYTRSQSRVVGKGEVGGEPYQFFRVFARGFDPSGMISRTLEARYVLPAGV